MICLARASAIEFQRQESLSCIFMKARTFHPFDEGQKRLGNDLIVHAVSTVETMVVLIVLHVFLEAIAGCVLISEEGDHLVIGICIPLRSSVAVLRRERLDSPGCGDGRLVAGHTSRP